ncbi:hypothetical protein AVEN_192805-1 [Araneus ventricosus]|uniref:Uncharacterized protein n=1 Tax=Araneus ventricosus TaxID=182803 RepID=A0A4Y2SQQ7_ARAVE|nr:hypothetical protein AVEN_192805-1 [Araneus ventricosus]
MLDSRSRHQHTLQNTLIPKTFPYFASKRFPWPRWSRLPGKKSSRFETQFTEDPPLSCPGSRTHPPLLLGAGRGRGCQLRCFPSSSGHGSKRQELVEK